MTGEPLDWTDAGPRSTRFGDVYFSHVDGLAESRSVFLAGCGLPQAWAGRSRFTVAELGFGTGLNILALVELWRRTRAPGARLNVFSVEAYPITAANARRALAAWPELAGVAAPMLDGWPDGRRGWRRIEWPQDGVILDLAIAEAGEALAAWDGRADAWFLDGFAPAKNPQMWRPELLAEIAAHSNPGAVVATFTVAGAVRRGLAEAGFAVEKRPGFGRKRERLEARLAGAAAAPSPALRVAVIGGGIAGAALTRAFRALGAEPVVIEALELGSGASGNPAALVTPRLDAGLGAIAALHAHAFARAVSLYRRETPQAVIAEGALQVEAGERDAARFTRLAAWDGFAAGALRPLDAEAAAARLEELAPGGLWFEDALVVEPAAVLATWCASAPVISAEVAALEQDADGWRLLDAAGAAVARADVVCLAGGAQTVALAPAPLRAVRGQASWAEAPFTGAPAAWGGYAVPTRAGVLFGATHDRDDLDISVRPEDHARNLQSLRQGRPALAARLADTPLQGRAGLRAATPDHLPLAGAVADRPGLFVLSGLGGRGFTLAPLLAEQVAALALGAPPPLPRTLAKIVDPVRYAGRGR